MRLQHSVPGFIRMMQMSSARLFAFVEGGLDRPFYERVIRTAAAGTDYEIVAAKELPGETGGKIALIGWFREMSGRGLLCSERLGKKLVLLFFVDRDAEGVDRRLVRSQHMIVTKPYDLEAHLFACGDIAEALAIAAHISLSQARALMPDGRAWLKRCVEAWRDWIALCLVSRRLSVNPGCTFDRVCCINDGAFGPVDATRVAQFTSAIAAKSGLHEAEVQAQLEIERENVALSVASNNVLRYMKGKWLKHLLQSHLEALPRVPDSNLNAIGDRVLALLVQMTRADGSCVCAARSARLVKRATSKILA